MKTNAEKRSYHRQRFSADVAFSYFNKEHSHFAQTLNLGSGGMCFRSDLFLIPGATICIHLKKIHPHASGECFCEGLRYISLAEVKWCSEVPDDDSHYATGVKYFGPAY